MPVRHIAEHVLCILLVAAVFAFFTWLLAGPLASMIVACSVMAMAGVSQMDADGADRFPFNRLRRRHESSP